MRAMKSKGIKHLFVIAVCSVFILCSLDSCLYMHHAIVYFNNTTSDTIFVTNGDAMVGDIVPHDSMVNVSCYYIQGSVSIGPGENRLVLNKYFNCDSPKESDISLYMEEFYPNGLKITFKDGYTISYSPDSATTDTNSPFAKDSYRIIPTDDAPWPKIGHAYDAYYDVSDTKSKE